MESFRKGSKIKPRCILGGQSGIFRVIITMLALVGMAFAHEERFDYNVDAYARSGDMYVRIFPS